MSYDGRHTVIFDDGERIEFSGRIEFTKWLQALPDRGPRRAFTWVNHETGNEWRVDPKEDAT